MNTSRQQDNSNKLTILYERLSQEDKLEGDSNSIVNQKRLLTEYAEKNGFRNLVHLTEVNCSSRTFFHVPG